ncbi:M20 family metallopeptidase [Halalkalicoccus salilacus]|uniref:M20 family metallopeptidase n=1 Tax=Halalkalicoccus TaxID=332246 RepID=UPI002F96348A
MTANATDVTELTRELVSIPNHESEASAGDAIESWLRSETDADVECDEAGNVFARRGEGERTLALVGHHDVVPPADEQVENGEYVVEERDGRLYGRGTADMKGSLAAAMCAFRDSEVPRTSSSRTASGDRVARRAPDQSSGIQPRDAESAGELVFASFIGEERGGVGARHAIENGFSPDFAVVGEGSTNYSGEGVTDVVVAHKGRRGSTITARGAASHASEPEAGENAIYRACDAVEQVRSMDAPSVEVLGNQLAGTVVVTEIDGGSAMNVVPDRCSVTVDERTVPGDRAPLEEVVDGEGVEWTVEQDLPPMRCSDEAFADRMLEAARTTQDGEPRPVTKPHATDAGWLADAGTACLIYGASEPGEAHTATESVSIDVLERCYRGYRAIAESRPRSEESTS